MTERFAGNIPEGFALYPNAFTDHHDDLVSHAERTFYGRPIVYEPGNDACELSQADSKEWEMWVKPLLLSRLESLGVETIHLNRLLTTRYDTGRGIRPHKDNTTIFGNTIVGVSLREQALFQLTGPGDYRGEVHLKPGDAYVMQGTARYEWKHGIADARRIKTPTDGFVDLARSRIALTLRQHTRKYE
jgi:alkylated DNA repair dioxygenase AlkB